MGGYITPEITGKFPGYLSPSQELTFNDIPNGLAAVSKVPAAGWAQIATYAAYCEISGISNRTEAPGDFGWKVLTSADPEEKKKKLAAEIANGRLAMMAIIGMFFQDGLTGSAWGDWANYTQSPLRAFEPSWVQQQQNDGYHRHVFSGWAHWVCLGRLGFVHGVPTPWGCLKLAASVENFVSFSNAMTMVVYGFDKK